mgnify:CR=1 FL=1
MSVILVVAAHPDDEILGVGATIAKRVAQGDIAYALILGEGQTSRWEDRAQVDSTIIDDLHKNTLQATEKIGYSDVYFEDLPDNRFDSVDLLEVIKKVEKHVQRIKPDVIYTHHAGDLNVDHRITFDAVLTATRPIGAYSVKEIYAFETVSSTEWHFGKKESGFYPNYYSNIEEYLEIKCEAMKEYETELCEFPHPRSLEMLKVTAKKWGSTVGKKAVEAFEIIRMVN